MTYYEERMDELGVNAQNNKVRLDNNPEKDAFENGKQQLHDTPIFTEAENGDIEILLYTLRRKYYKYFEQGVRSAGPRTKYDVITRFTPEHTAAAGRKYNITGKTGTHPWFHPFFLDAFEKKEKIPALAITEGAFKGWKATECGLPTVAFSSITHYKDKNTQTLHPEVLELIEACQVDNIVILWDGDCLNISQDALNDGEDLAKRPNGFFSSIRAIQEMLKDYVDAHKVNIWFAHVNTHEIEGNPKGLDDLFCAFPKEHRQIVDDFNNFKKPGSYFKRFNITSSTQRLQKYFRINNVQDFYAFHSERIKDNEFVYFGTKYQWSAEDKELKVVSPGQANFYFRVGDNYFKKIEKPNKFGQNEKVYVRLSKSTIQDDYGKNFIKHVKRYNAFCVVPDHTNYQEVIHGCYNAYHPFEHEPAEGECPQTLALIKHIFQEHYELGLDYVQLLYQRPQLQLPILCLVSKENKTGKTTLANWLKLIFAGNMAIVGNQELSDNFNASWSSKLIICCDESFIEKKATVEKIKALSTANKIYMNAKGRDHEEIDFFGKIILITNNEDNFIYANENDKRYWIRKVPVLPDEKNVLPILKDEIPAFLHFLNHRKMHVPDTGTRMYFPPELLATNALKKVIEYNEPTVIKEIKSRMAELFLDFGVKEILMTAKTIQREWFSQRTELNYLNRLLSENLKLEHYKNADGKEVVKRYTWPRYHVSYDEGIPTTKQTWVHDTGRPYVFKREVFVTPEMENVVIDESVQEDSGEKKFKATDALPAIPYETEKDDELPF